MELESVNEFTRYSEKEVKQILLMKSDTGRFLFKSAFDPCYIKYRCTAMTEDGQCAQAADELGGTCNVYHKKNGRLKQFANYAKKSKDLLDSKSMGFFNASLSERERNKMNFLKDNYGVEDKLREVLDLSMVMLNRCQEYITLKERDHNSEVIRAFVDFGREFAKANPFRKDEVNTIISYLCQQSITKPMNDLLKNITLAGNVSKEYSLTDRYKNENTALWDFAKTILEVVVDRDKPDQQRDILNIADKARKILYRDLLEVHKFKPDYLNNNSTVEKLLIDDPNEDDSNVQTDSIISDRPKNTR